ncbi:MAG: VWA domain-containing protein [Acidobacteriaceae bacterium]|nr:VWA domain-containing protein [Acidobacteriaceae bacterium]
MRSSLIACVILLPFIASLRAQHTTFSTTTNVVIVNVSVLDRNGRPIENLTKDDFELYEDGKFQKLQAVDLQRLNNAVLPDVHQTTEQPTSEPKGYNPDAEKAKTHSDLLSKYQDRRLMVLLFDFSSMQPAEQIRAKDAAVKFLSSQMTSSDTVSIMTYGNELKTLLDFTSDRDLLISTIERFRIGESSENASSADTGADSEDQSGQFVADETEFNIFNADLKLAALEDAARTLGQYPEKKALIYISSGIQKSGVDNQSQLRATVNTAVRANVAFYPIDARGLTALVPGGDATQQGAAGSNLYSGAGQRSLKENFINQQETLATLALDTGGKALLDSNDLTEGIRQVQHDFTSYYVLSYVSSNTAQDGRYRRIQVKLAPREATLRAKLDYRQGYYGPATFAHMRDVDKEAQLSQALLSENPVTDLPLAVEVDYFRLEKDKYFAPISVKIPGSALEFHGTGVKRATELDFIAEVFDARNRPAATVRDTIPLKLDQTTVGKVIQKSIQYDTGVTLTPGPYRLRFVARENGEGKVGTFETSFTVPDLAARKTLRTSSLIVASQRVPMSDQVGGVKNDKKLLSTDPLIQDGEKLVPNVTKVFRPGQNVLVYLEVYDPASPNSTAPTAGHAAVETTFALYRNNRKVFETRPLAATSLIPSRPGTLPICVTVPTTDLATGKYQAQLNVIDQAGRKFAFPQTEIAILAAPRVLQQTQQSSK